VNVSFIQAIYAIVPFGENGINLRNHLRTATPHTDGIYYIKVTGLKAEDLYGCVDSFRAHASTLGEVLKNNPTKKVALKLGEIPGLTDMSWCFFMCEKLIQVHEIPKDRKLKVDQIAIGSCTNSSYSDFMKLAAILDGKKVHPDVSLVLSPGSSNIMKMISENGALAKFIAAGARLLEAACGPCIGMGQAPKTDGISLRTFNRNFKGRCGTMSAGVYLVSTETAAASAITGYLTDPRELGAEIIVEEPEKFEISDNYFIFPNPNEVEAKKEREAVKIVMGPNIKPFPIGEELQDSIARKVILKTGDNITTDDICPSNAALLPFRSNIPKLSEHCFETIIPDFKERAEKNNGGIIVGGENYGQGSSREHAALLPLYLGIKAVIAKSFARIHKANLINSGIIPLEFENVEDYDKIDEYDELQLSDIPNSLINGRFIIKNITKNTEFPAKFNGSARELKILKFGGYLKFATSDEFLS